ncbi:Molybdopterin-synthase adenylyltransferase [Botrimarina colliarenosi]|uniref:Molybdopterin-synthase adenylyltransferase n=1 Tax=Botrimarina colliarenosi TaxID=2528001 RepID=A0A5C6AD00_9BACT|nr:ThiF family adenylyltransferase [Botrimarina colliarenosi]TWT97045.1 Molybdopterin-synthase adenylyltransferase [Botrimarina colliarenosi]
MPPKDPYARYAKQTRFAPLGEAGQARLATSSVLLCGCGALGSVIASTLVRAGVGKLTVVDRDFLEVSNLQRQVLFDENDIAEGLPKAVAAANHLRAANSTVEVEPLVADVTAANLPSLAAGCDLLLDGTDNFETRLLLNDYAVREGVPWVYGGVIGAEGRVMPIVPGSSACLACLLPEPPAAGETETCDSAGVLGPAVNVVASLQAMEAIKLLAGAGDAIAHGLTVVDLWAGRWRRLAVPRDPSCRCCGQRQFDWLEGRRGSRAVVLCGRGAVQISPPEGSPPVDLAVMRAKLAPLGVVAGNAHLLRLNYDGHEVTLFADGRAIISGVDDEAAARSVWNRVLGG